MTTKRGLFVVLEGMDRAGKSTQCKRLADHLNSLGHRTRLMRFPERDSPIGSLIGQYLERKLELDDHAVHLLFSANRWEFRSQILATLGSGVNILCDRYSYSGVAFTSAKEDGPDFDWCCQPEVGLPAPDLKIFLSVSPEAQASRGGFGAERYEVAAFQRRVGAAYSRLMRLEDAKASKEDGDSAAAWLTVNADASLDEVHNTLADIVLAAVDAPRRSDEPAKLAFDSATTVGPLTTR